MATTYKVHYAERLALKGVQKSGSWWASKGGLPGSPGRNPAQCNGKAQQIDYSTDPTKVTCLKCGGPS